MKYFALDTVVKLIQLFSDCLSGSFSVFQYFWFNAHFSKASVTLPCFRRIPVYLPLHQDKQIFEHVVRVHDH